MKDDDGGDEDDGGGVRLMRCAVIECARPVFSMSVALGFLILGEENGVRVFGLRRLVKGRGGKRKQLRNRGGGLEVVNCNGDLEGKMERHGVAVKQTNVKFKHDDRDGGSCFVALKGNEVKTKSTTKVSMSIKAISIQAVSQRMFLILDSRGDLHLLCLSNSGIGVDITSNVKQLHRIMKVQSLAVLPDLSTMSQTIWISDGCHSVHMFTAMDIENALNEANDCNDKLMHLPVNRVLFSSEKIQDIISLAANSILILGQGSLYAYAIS